MAFLTTEVTREGNRTRGIVITEKPSSMKVTLSKRLRIVCLILLTITLAFTLSSSALSNSRSQEPPPPAEITLGAEDDGRQIELSEGQVLVIGLASNPSTGYLWEMDGFAVGVESTGILRQVGDTEFEHASHLPAALDRQTGPEVLGAPATQILRFEAVDAGQTTLRLIYHRPWEELAAPAQTFSLEVQGVGPFTGADGPATTSSPRPAPESPELSNSDAPLGLDSAFNWCDLGGCTQVKAQGNCGSCWAFSTVGLLESQILLQDGETKDLSEQYLLSCNTDSWSCDGGWFAHDYHEWKIPGLEPDFGAVDEADFQYVAWDAACDPPHTHQEKIISWAYVGNWWSVPSDASIKQAIYDYGPVSAAVCAGLSWGGYDSESGVFDTDETQWCINIYGQSVNHAIVLVGWDDTQGTNGVWILRNSWGPGWGEDGYMLIEYGISDVGYAANYIVYSPACYDLSTSASPSVGGNVAANPSPNCGGDGYEPGTEVELTASGSSGWHFTNWSGDASGATSPITITMDTHQSIGAHFMCDGCAPLGYVPLGMKE